MARKETVFAALSVITPDFAAALAQQASQFNAPVFIEHRNMCLSVDSLIGILSLNLRKGMTVTVTAEGDDAAAAVESVCAMLAAEY